MENNSAPEKLLAKSKRNNREITLESHLLDTEMAAREAFRLDGRWGQNWCRFFRINEKENQERFLLNLYVASLFHDIGKANLEFYNAVAGPGFIPQTVRHEHISGLILCLPEIRMWISKNPQLDIDVITAAVLSHHIKVSEEVGDWQWCQPKGAKILKLYLQHEEVKSILKRIALLAGLEDPPELPTKSWGQYEPWQSAWKSGKQFANNFRRGLRSDENRLSLLLATKAGLIVADSVASGIVLVYDQSDTSITGWLDENVHTESIAEDSIANAIINPRIDQIIKKNGPFRWHDFQNQITLEGSRILLIAACAAGKTLAAWKWAEAQSKERTVGKVIFLYPTRTTALEGFRDYVGWAPEGESSYLAGDSRYVLESMAANPSESTKGKKLQLSEEEERLFALGLWSHKYFSATVDQFLSFIEHSYMGICLLPVLADSVVIFDEVHSFDQKMFTALISFLRTFDIPVLCMTATLPTSRRADLEKAGLRIYPRPGQFKDQETLEDHPRYQLISLKDEEEAFNKAVNSYQSGDRVLWVVNTVDRCQQIADRLAEKLGLDVLSYHSRFCLYDRHTIHGETVKAFQQKERPAIAVTTQVCEMSLDLDADVLITELAPISSLVQRFGRANRHLAHGPDFRATLCVYSLDSNQNRPYSREELSAASVFLKALGTGDISQRSMADKLVEHSLKEPETEVSAKFLESGYFATPGCFRDIDELAAPCVLDSDLDAVKKLLDQKKPIDLFVINVPRGHFKKDKSHPEWLLKYLGIANGENYCHKRGFRKDKVRNAEAKNYK